MITEYLWEKYDYRDFGIIGEPYFDINFEEVLYLTDTGQKMGWGSSLNKRRSSKFRAQSSGQKRKV